MYRVNLKNWNNIYEVTERIYTSNICHNKFGRNADGVVNDIKGSLDFSCLDLFPVRPYEKPNLRVSYLDKWISSLASLLSQMIFRKCLMSSQMCVYLYPVDMKPALQLPGSSFEKFLWTSNTFLLVKLFLKYLLFILVLIL